MGEYSAHAGRMRHTICDAMVTLLSDKPFTKITVQDILQTANIQRATFYRYFKDKYEVAEAINHILAEHLTRHAFDGIYRRTGLPENYQIAFDARYRKVLHQMLRLRIENVDLSQTLVDTFRASYEDCFPDCDPYESYLAGRNFLSSATWFVEQDLSVKEIRNLLFSNSMSRWMARYHNISPESLSEFVDQQREADGESRALEPSAG